MTDSSDCESDAGASPSVSSDESVNSCSSRSLSPVPKKVEDGVQQCVPRKRNTTNAPTPGSPSSTVMNTPPSSLRKVPRKRQTSSVSSQSVASGAGNVSKGKSSDLKVAISQNSENAPTTNASVTRKRKRSSLLPTPSKTQIKEDSKSSPNKRKERNKRRRTRSERNLLAGKTGNTPIIKTPVVPEGVEGVALDAEIDRVLEEKQMKNNLSATNVKSIIRHVITNNMVQKMIMSSVKKKAEVADAGESSDDDGLLEPKMTRAKTKELMENKKISLWPIVDSPVKMKKHPVSETHMLIQHDLPEDSSGDEEYVPKENDIHESMHSDDESSSVASVASDTSSPATPKHGVKTRSSLLANPIKLPFNDPLFKTPPPKPTSTKKSREGSAISLRTRSKLPLTDTPLEDLERQFVPPDVTNDMYDWGTETDNEDYLAFLKDFLNPRLLNENDGNEVDDEADPEYNFMEDDEDLHDREELRRDRAVKVPKKELTQLIAELFEPGMLSDEFEDHDLASLTNFTPLINDSGFSEDGRPVVNTDAVDIQNSEMDQSLHDQNVESSSCTLNVTNSNVVHVNPNNSQEIGSVQLPSTSNYCPQVIVNDEKNILTPVIDQVNGVTIKAETESRQSNYEGAVQSSAIQSSSENTESLADKEPLFRECDIKFLQHQMQQHIQLLAQSYVLTVSGEDPVLKHIAKTTRTMIIELKNFSEINPFFSVCNLQPAWTLANYWPHKILQQSPIKKKILEEKYISESGVSVNGKSNGMGGTFFPRHVVKVIAESSTFMYDHLLPECYDQTNLQSRCHFCYAEDVLLAGALEEFKKYIPEKVPVSQMADVISEVLLVVHSPQSIYHRIRNLRKSKGLQQYRIRDEIKKYYLEGILPEVDRSVPAITDAQKLPLIQRNRENLSRLWRCLLQHLEESSSYVNWMDNWDSLMNKGPVRNDLKEKKCKKEKKTTNSENKKATSRRKSDTINRVFPQGTLDLEKTNPDMEAIPLYDGMGRTGAIIRIPKYAIPKPPQPSEPFKPKFVGANLKFEDQSTQGGARSNAYSFKRVSNFSCWQPKEAAEAGNQSPESPHLENLEESASDKLDMDSQNLVLPLEKPRNRGPKLDEHDVKVSPSYPISVSVPQDQLQYSVVEAVGKPFDLPELKCVSRRSNEPVIVDVASLQTPMKIKIFDKLQNQYVVKVEEVVEGEFSDDSGNVIEEGTEVELSEEEAEEVFNCKTPETINLSDGEDVKPILTLTGGNNNCKGDSSTKTCDNDSTNKQSSSTCAASASSTSSLSSSSRKRFPPQSGTNGDDSDEDGEKRFSGRKRNLPKDCERDSDSYKEEECSNDLEKDENEDGSNAIVGSTISQSKKSQSAVTSNSSVTVIPTFSPPIQQIASSSTGNKAQKKPKRSPGTSGNNQKVSISKNVTPEEEMLEDDPVESEDAAYARMEEFLSKIQSATEAKHPGLYNSFIQLLIEYGEESKRAELPAKVRILLKDYPELIREFESYADPPTVSVPENSSLTSSPAKDSSVTEITFLQKLEKFTEKTPQLRTKIINKVKSIKEGNPNVTEKELASALEPFFMGNPAMISNFRDLFPSVYRSEPTSSSIDFEATELDMEESSKESKDDIQFKKSQSAVASNSSISVIGLTKPISSPPIQQLASKSNGGKVQKKPKRSPGTSGNKRRVSKYNVTPAEEMLEDDPGEFEDVANAHMEVFLSKIQSVTEAKHPGLYNSFIQLLIEYGEESMRAELPAKVRILFKDYPELIREFESYLDTPAVSVQENSILTGSSAKDSALAEITFLQKLEKFAEKAPQLKAKIINKFKSIKEGNPNVTEKELASALEPFFLGNPVMMPAFRDLLPSVYRPQSTSNNIDFEVIELDMEEPSKESNDDLQFEIIKLPEETSVPATNTCSCSCHTKTSDPAFSSRSKHCKNCSVKFQDGKIFFHNGRVMRPVSVELTPASPKQQNYSTSTCSRSSGVCSFDIPHAT